MPARKDFLAQLSWSKPKQTNVNCSDTRRRSEKRNQEKLKASVKERNTKKLRPSFKRMFGVKNYLINANKKIKSTILEMVFISIRNDQEFFGNAACPVNKLNISNASRTIFLA